MKLRDIFEKRVEFKLSNKSIHGLLQNNKLEHLGTGVSAIAYAHKKRPNTVIKTIQMLHKDDVMFAFIRLCINHKNNPFFPKIYAAKLYNIKRMDDDEREQLFQLIDPTDTPPEEGMYIMLVVMEKLYPIHTPDNREIAITLLRELGIVPQNIDDVPVDIRGARDSLSRTKYPFEDPNIRHQLRHTSANSKFKEALRLLEPLFNVSEPDLHKKNIMLRKTNNGPEIVLVDPVVSV